MSTDPTATHHAEILDYLSAALTEPDTQEIVLTQDRDDSGRWKVVIHQVVDPAYEAKARSRADRETVYNLKGDTPPPPAWVAEALKDPDPVSKDAEYLLALYGFADGTAWDTGKKFLPGFSGTDALEGRGW